MIRDSLWRSLVVGLVLLQGAYGATSQTWETSGFTEMLKGRLTGLSLTPDGVLKPGPARRWSIALGQPALWSIALAPDGSVYAATGHSGRVYRIDANGQSTQVWASEQAEVFALAVDNKGRVYAGTSPNGGVYRLEGGRAEKIWQSPVKYIWNLALASDGAIYAGTGERGQIFKLDGEGKGEVYYETEQGNVTALALGAGGRLFAGTEPNGIVYEISGPKKGTVLYDSSLPEIRSIVPIPDGSLYVAAMGGAVSTRTSGASASPSATTSGVVTATNPTVITVTEAHGSQDMQAGTRPSVSSTVTTPGATASTAAATTVSEVAGVEKSAVYRIGADRTVDTIRSSKEDNVYDLASMGDSLLVATDVNGRIYKMDGSRSSLVAEPGEGEATRILRNELRLYVALSNPARVIALDLNRSGAASYVSTVHDSGSVARWGHLQWRAASDKGLKFQTRTGNSVRPDATWSDWATPNGEAQHGLIVSPVARYIQWRGEWDSGSSADCLSVTVPYLSQNGAPTVRSISATSVLGTNPAKAAAGAAASSSAYSVTVTDTGEAPASTSSAAGQTVSRLQTTQTQVTWQADDPDSDKMTFALYFRPEEAKEWQLIRSRMSENTLLLDPDVFADGRYLFRVVASDAPANAPQYAKQNELVSAPVLVDNTPPVLTMSRPRRNGTTVDIEFTATDATSSLKKCEYSLDGLFWQPIEAADGLTDTQAEKFFVHLEKLRPGEHLIVFRAYDTAGNAGLGRVLVQ